MALYRWKDWNQIGASGSIKIYTLKACVHPVEDIQVSVSDVTSQFQILQDTLNSKNIIQSLSSSLVNPIVVSAIDEAENFEINDLNILSNFIEDFSIDKYGMEYDRVIETDEPRSVESSEEDLRATERERDD